MKRLKKYLAGIYLKNKMELITLKNYKNKILTGLYLFFNAVILYYLFFINNDEIITLIGTVAVILLLFIWMMADLK